MPFLIGFPTALGVDYALANRYWEDPQVSFTLWYTRQELFYVYQAAMSNYFYRVFGRFVGYTYVAG